MQHNQLLEFGVVKVTRTHDFLKLWHILVRGVTQSDG